MKKLNVKRMAKKAEEIVLFWADAQLSGLEKRESAAEALISWLDKHIEPESKPLEWASDALITVLCHALIEAAYQSLKGSGRLPSKVVTDVA